MSTHKIMHEVTEVPWLEYVFILVNLMEQPLITLAAHLLCCMCALCTACIHGAFEYVMYIMLVTMTLFVRDQISKG